MSTQLSDGIRIVLFGFSVCSLLARALPAPPAHLQLDTVALHQQVQDGLDHLDRAALKQRVQTQVAASLKAGAR